MSSVWDLVKEPEDLTWLSVSEFDGLALVGTGLLVVILARITIWRSSSSTLVVREWHRLITHGVYRYLRHPIYAGVIMGCMGVPVHAQVCTGSYSWQY